MTKIPTIEKTETARCSACARDCMQLCTKCGRNFCTNHLLAHLEKCSGYKAVIRSILRDDLTEIAKQVIEVMLRTIWPISNPLTSPWDSDETTTML